MTELDRTIPLPTPSELSAIDTDLRAIGQTISRGLTITGPVGEETGATWAIAGAPAKPSKTNKPAKIRAVIALLPGRDP